MRGDGGPPILAPMKTMTPLRRALYALFALAVAAVAAWAVAELFLLSGASQLGRIRAAASAGAMLLLLATFESIRRTQLKERYALLWVVPSLAILLLAFFPVVLEAVRRYFGMEWGSTMAGVAFLSLLLAVFVISRTLSRNENDIARIAQYAARLEERLRRLEEERREPPSGGYTCKATSTVVCWRLASMPTKAGRERA